MSCLRVQPPLQVPVTSLALPRGRRPNANPAVFNDALVVRTQVFVDEQKCSADAEIDDDDPRSWHWVMYDKVHGDEDCGNITTGSCFTPIAVIRLVPPPHIAHELVGLGQVCMEPQATKPTTALGYDTKHEPYIKLTRVAVVKRFRGRGLARRLVDTALEWARQHATEIDEASTRRQDLRPWKGLVLVHAQVAVEKMYEKMGFVTDELLGRWDEEGIEHLGMWRRIEVD